MTRRFHNNGDLDNIGTRNHAILHHLNLKVHQEFTGWSGIAIISGEDGDGEKGEEEEQKQEEQAQRMMMGRLLVIKSEGDLLNTQHGQHQINPRCNYSELQMLRVLKL